MQKIGNVGGEKDEIKVGKSKGNKTQRLGEWKGVSAECEIMWAKVTWANYRTTNFNGISQFCHFSPHHLSHPTQTSPLIFLPAKLKYVPYASICLHTSSLSNYFLKPQSVLVGLILPFGQHLHLVSRFHCSTINPSKIDVVSWLGMFLLPFVSRCQH